MKPSDTGWSIYFEVTTVQGKDARNAFALGHGDERRVSKIHGQVAIFLHQLAHAAMFGGAYREPVLAAARATLAA